MYPGGQQYPDPRQWPQNGGHGDPQQGYPPPPQGYPPPTQGYPSPQQPAYPAGAGYPQGYPYPPQPVPPQRSGQRSLFVVVAAVAVFAMLSVLGVAVWVLTSRHHTPADPVVAGGSSAPGTSTGGKGTPPGTPADGLVVGSGPVRVDVYVDYQCPPCSAFEQATADTLDGDVSSAKVTLHLHPVAFIDNRSKNRYSTRAAAAEACAAAGGRTLEFHSYLLSHQPAEDTAGPTDADLVTAGHSVGLGTSFDTCVTGKQQVAWVGTATSYAEDHGVSSVPMLYVNDKSVDATESALTSAVDAAS